MVSVCRMRRNLVHTWAKLGRSVPGREAKISTSSSGGSSSSEQRGGCEGPALPPAPGAQSAAAPASMRSSSGSVSGSLSAAAVSAGPRRCWRRRHPRDGPTPQRRAHTAMPSRVTAAAPPPLPPRVRKRRREPAPPESPSGPSRAWPSHAPRPPSRPGPAPGGRRVEAPPREAPPTGESSETSAKPGDSRAALASAHLSSAGLLSYYPNEYGKRMSPTNAERRPLPDRGCACGQQNGAGPGVRAALTTSRAWD